MQVLGRQVEDTEQSHCSAVDVACSGSLSVTLERLLAEVTPHRLQRIWYGVVQRQVRGDVGDGGQLGSGQWLYCVVPYGSSVVRYRISLRSSARLMIVIDRLLVDVAKWALCTAIALPTLDRLQRLLPAGLSSAALDEDKT